jgi:hypothetical protein
MSVPAGVFTNVVAGLAVVVVVVLDVDVLLETGADVAAGAGADVEVVVAELVVVVLVVDVLEELGELVDVDELGGVVLKAFAPGCAVVVVLLPGVVLVVDPSAFTVEVVVLDPSGCAVVVVAVDEGEVVELPEPTTVVVGALVGVVVVDVTVVTTGATVVTAIDDEVLVEVADTPLVNNERSAWAAPRICAGSAPSHPESTDEYTRRKSIEGTRF